MRLKDYRELMRRIKDVDDPIRFLIVSALSKRMVLYYNVTDDVFSSDVASGTVFKRRPQASAIANLLKNDVQVVKAKARKGKPPKLVARIRYKLA